jgi:hypothetical protein
MIAMLITTDDAFMQAGGEPSVAVLALASLLGLIVLFSFKVMARDLSIMQWGWIQIAFFSAVSAFAVLKDPVSPEQILYFSLSIAATLGVTAVLLSLAQYRKLNPDAPRRGVISLPKRLAKRFSKAA